MLTELADFLDTLPPERFDYGRWVGEGWKGDRDLSCDATACAGGHATTLSSFRKARLYLVQAPGWRPPGIVACMTDDGPIFGIDAMAHVLGIDYVDAAYLFVPAPYGSSPDRDATPAEVAAHIRRWLSR